MPPRSRRRIWRTISVHRFEVRLDDGVFEARRAAAHVLAGVDVDGDERFGVVDDDVPAGLEPHFRAQRFVEVLLNAELLEDRRFLGVELHAADQLGLEAADEFDDLAELLFVVEPDGDVVVAQVIAQDALHQIQVAVEQGRRAALFGTGADGVPGAAQKFDVGADFVVACAAGRGAHDKSAGECSLRFGHHAAQARAVFRRADAARHADVIHRGHVDQEAARQRDVAGDARALLAQRLLGDLNDDFLARLQHFGNELRAAVLFVARVAVLTCCGRGRWSFGRPPSASTALRSASAAHGPLEPGAGLFGNARAGGLGLGELRRLRRFVSAFRRKRNLPRNCLLIGSAHCGSRLQTCVLFRPKTAAAMASSCISSASASASAASCS